MLRVSSACVHHVLVARTEFPVSAKRWCFASFPTAPVHPQLESPVVPVGFPDESQIVGKEYPDYLGATGEPGQFNHAGPG